ncbi:hypothetical protein Tco_0635385 [Tanacetum coccineum]
MYGEEPAPQIAPVESPQMISTVKLPILKKVEYTLWSMRMVAELAQTKQTYGIALTKLIKKVKKLEQSVKSTQARRRFRIVVSDDEEGTSWIQEDIEIQEKISDDTKVVLEEEEPTELVEDQGSGEKGEKEVSTIDVEHSTIILEVSTAAENLVYIRRSAEKKKDKGKGIMTEPEPEKKTKKQLEQERLGHEEAVRLQEQLNEEETQRIVRDAEIARQLHEEINKAGQERVVGGYKMNYFMGIKYKDIRPIFEKVWDQIQSFAPMDSEKEKEDDIEKEELKAYLDLVPREEFAMEIKSLGTKYPIVDWKTHILTENFMYYQIIRADKGSKNYKIFSEMLDDFDRQDVINLHRLVEERYTTSRPEGYDLMLWGDLKILFQPDEEDKNCHSYDDREEVSAYSRNAIKDVKQKTRGLTALIDKKKVIITETSIKSDLHLEDAGDSGIPTDSLQTPITTQPSSSRTQKKQSRRTQRKDTAIAQEETQQDDSVPTPSNDPPLSGEDSMQLSELMLFCTNLQKQVLDLEKEKDAQAKEIADLKKRVQKLERKKKSRTTSLKRLKKVGMSRRVESSKDQESLDDHEDASKQGRSIEDIDKDVDVSLVDDTQRRLDDSAKEREVDTSVEDSAAPTTIEEITLAQTLIQIKAAKPKVVTTAATTTTTTRSKARGVIVQEPSEFRTSQESQPLITKDKGKAIMIEPEAPLKRKDQVALDEYLA